MADHVSLGDLRVDHEYIYDNGTWDTGLGICAVVKCKEIKASGAMVEIITFQTKGEFVTEAENDIIYVSCNRLYER